MYICFLAFAALGFKSQETSGCWSSCFKQSAPCVGFGSVVCTALAVNNDQRIVMCYHMGQLFRTSISKYSTWHLLLAQVTVLRRTIRHAALHHTACWWCAVHLQAAST